MEPAVSDGRKGPKLAWAQIVPMVRPWPGSHASPAASASVRSAAGASLADVVRVGGFLKDLADFKDFNEVYTTFFAAPYPARTTVQATPPGCLVEMDAIVRLKT